MLQNVMGWTNSHLHQFIKNGEFYCDPDLNDELDSIDYRKIRLDKLLQNNGDQLIYEYDFGDGWEHILSLEEILKDPTHEEYDEYLTWLGGRFDPEHIDLERANKGLLKRFYGMPYLPD